jgi:hypothetical protein
VEELWKALFVRWDRLRRQHRVGATAKAHAVSALALALGYATAQSLLFVVVVTAILENNARDSPNEEALSGAEFGWMVFWSLFFGVVTMPLNLMGTYLTGIAIAKAGEDSGECCCCPGAGACCDTAVCGFPPSGEPGVRAFLRLLRWPLLLRTLLVTQFMLWITYLDVGLSFMMNVISVGVLYLVAYRVVQCADAAPTDDDVYRSVYGFQLLVDDGAGAAAVRPRTGGAPSGGGASGRAGALWGVGSKAASDGGEPPRDVEAQAALLRSPPLTAAAAPVAEGYAAPAPLPAPTAAAGQQPATGADAGSGSEEEEVALPGASNPLHGVALR